MKHRRHRDALTRIEHVVVLVVIAALIALVIPAIGSAREAARRNSCLNNMKQMSLGLLNYESAKGEFPPAHTIDPDGKPLHSWRTLNLPFMEQDWEFPLRMIKRDKSWDDPANAKLFNSVLETYKCPSIPGLGNRTNYLAIVTPTSFLQPAVPRKLADVKDPPVATLVFMDADEKHAVHWMAPTDADETLALSVADPQWQGPHGSGILASFADGHGKWLPAGTSPDVIRALITIAGGEEPDDAE